MIKVQKNYNSFLLIGLSWMLISFFPPTMVAANPCATEDGYLDSGIGGTGRMEGPGEDPDEEKGIGGTGFLGKEDATGIGGTGRMADGFTNGIGGTGKRPLNNNELIYVTGTIHAFGSVCVNGVEIQYSTDTPVSTGVNQKLKTASLRIGQVVDVIAEKKAGQTMPRARSISVRFPVQGPVAGVSPDGRFVKVMGRTVKLTGPQAGKMIRPGAHIRVSGLRNPHGQIVATYIETLPARLPAKTKPFGGKAIPFHIKNLSVQGYVQNITPEGRVNIDGQTFDLGPGGKNIKIGQRLIISGQRRESGGVQVTKWIHEKKVVKTRLQFSESDGKRGRGRGRNRGHGSDDDDNRGRDDDKSGHSGRDRSDRSDNDRDDDRPDNDFDNSGPGNREDRPDLGDRLDDDVERFDRIDNSGRGSDRSDRVERVERSDNSGSGKVDRPEKVAKPDKPDKIQSPEKFDRPEKIEHPQKIEKPQRPEKTEKPEKIERPERAEKPDRSGRPERPERVERPDKSERPERPERPERVERPDRSERPERPERPDNSGRGGRG